MLTAAAAAAAGHGGDRRRGGAAVLLMEAGGYGGYWPEPSPWISEAPQVPVLGLCWAQPIESSQVKTGTSSSFLQLKSEKMYVTE